MIGVAKICDLSLLDIIAFIYFCYCDKFELDIIAFSYFFYFHGDRTEPGVIAFSYLLSHYE